jgi:hypothetical protein
MPSPMWKGTAFINSQSQDAGWSISLFPNGSTQDDAASNFLTVLLAYQAMMRVVDSIVYARVDNTDTTKDSVVVPHSFPIAGTYAGGEGAVPLHPDVAILDRLVGTPTQKNHKFLHGLYSTDCPDGVSFIPSLALSGFLLAFNNAVIANCNVGKVDPTLGYSVAIMSASAAGGVSNRKVGRPFGLFRGRRRPSM